MTAVKMLLIGAACFIAGCTTTLPARDARMVVANTDPYYGEFEVMAARMGVVLSGPEHDDDQVTFLLHDSFTHSIAIVSYFDRSQSALPVRGYLLVSIRDIQSDVFEEQNGVTRGSYSFQVYETTISADQFSEIRNQASRREFLERPFSNRPVGANSPACLDGTIYAIGARIAGKNHVVRRHNCDEGFSQAIASAAALIASAKTAFPELRELLSRTEADISGWD